MAMPAFTSWTVDSAVTSVPSNTMRPDARVDAALDAQQGGGLAGAVGAEDAGDRSGRGGERDAAEPDRVAEADRQVVDLEQVLVVDRSFMSSRSEVRGDDRLVGPHFGRGSGGEQTARRHHRDDVGERHQEVHVVLDDDDRDAEPVADPPDRVGQRGGLGHVHPDGWLVEQQDGGPELSAHRDHREALGGVADRAALAVERIVEAEGGADLVESRSVSSRRRRSLSRSARRIDWRSVHVGNSRVVWNVRLTPARTQ